MLFQGLDQVDWKNLSHAHGEASGVPELLDRLCSADPIVRSEACGELFETVWHQGTIYPASAEILPFLFQIIDQKARFSPDEVDGQYIPGSDEMAVGLICSIATGESWLAHALGVSGLEQVETRLGGLGRSLEVERELEEQTMQSIRECVGVHREILRGYLDSPEGLGDIVAEVVER